MRHRAPRHAGHDIAHRYQRRHRHRWQLHSNTHVSHKMTARSSSTVYLFIYLFIYYASSAVHEKKNTYTIQDNTTQYKTKYMAYCHTEIDHVSKSGPLLFETRSIKNTEKFKTELSA